MPLSNVASSLMLFTASLGVAPVPGISPADICKGTGYKGWFGIHLSMRISDELNRIIMTNGNAIDTAEQAQRQGIRELEKPGLLKLRQSVTSLVEVQAGTIEHT